MFTNKTKCKKEIHQYNFVFLKPRALLLCHKETCMKTSITDKAVVLDTHRVKNENRNKLHNAVQGHVLEATKRCNKCTTTFPTYKKTKLKLGFNHLVHKQLRKLQRNLVYLNWKNLIIGESVWS